MTRELIVLAHELSQGRYSRLGGSLLVLAEYSKSATAALGLLVGPAGAAIAVLGGFVVAAARGAAESKALTDALILTGDASGATYSGLTNAARGIAAIAGTRGAAAEALASLASSGAVGAQNMEKFALVAVRADHDIGQSIEETTKQFVELGKSPLEASIRLNDSLHYLTKSTIDQIKALEDQGRASEAASVAQNAYADAMLIRTTQIEGNLGLLSTAWRGVTDAAKHAWDTMLNIGRTPSLDDQLGIAAGAVDAARARLAALQGGAQQSGSKNFANRGANYGGTQAAQDELRLSLENEAALQRRRLLEDNVATSAKAAADAASAHSRFIQEGNKYLTQQQRMEQEIAAAVTTGTAGGESQKAIDDRVAAIKASYAKTKAVRDTSRQEARASLQQELDQVRAFAAQEADVYRVREDELRRMRSADLIGDQQYLTSLSAAESDYLAALVKARDEEAADIAKRRSATTDKGERARLDEEATKSSERYANTIRDTARQVTASYLDSDARAAEYARDTTKTNQRLTADLITDTTARATALADLDIAEQQRRVSLFIEGTDSRKAAEAAFADWVVLRNKQLTEELKPEWQKMLEGYRDTVAYMRKASDEFTTGFINDGRDAFVDFVTTGKLSVSNLVGFIEQQFAKMVYDQYLAKYAAQLGSTIFSGISNLFKAGAGLSTEDYGSSGFAKGLNPDYSNEGIHMATGTNYVPYDGLKAVLHKGEAVVPKEYNPAAGGTADGAINLTVAPVFHGGVTRNDLANGMQTAVQMAVGQVANLRRRGNAAFVGS